jgi:hypothetical protein
MLSVINLLIKIFGSVLLFLMTINYAISQDTRIRYIGYEIELIDGALIQFWEDFANVDEIGQFAVDEVSRDAE